MDKDRVIADMKSCEQASGLTVYDHGVAVRDRMEAAFGFFQGRGPRFDWKWPTWLTDNIAYFRALASRDSLPDWREYALLHDCGKPYCRAVDDQGRAHFPGHARVSAEVYREHWGDESVARLIANDMLMHSGSPEDVAAAGLSEDEEALLLISALCEIHANAALFGGTASESFKIKFKKLERRGRAFARRIAVQPAS